MANADPLLSPEEFTRRQNNFHMLFLGKPGEHHMGDVYRNSSVAYKMCMVSHPENFSELAAELEGLYVRIGSANFHDPTFQEKLYAAYKMMHPYAETNWQLFR